VDREVAIKLLPLELFQSAVDRAFADGRFVREEARAMAKS
jgi:hypothetical protein